MSPRPSRSPGDEDVPPTRKWKIRNYRCTKLKNSDNEVYELRSILLIDIRDIVNYLLGNILELPFIVPQLIKITDVIVRHRRRQADRCRTQVVASLKTKVSSCELIERPIDKLIFRIIAGQKSIHRATGHICLESCRCGICWCPDNCLPLSLKSFTHESV